MSKQVFITYGEEEFLLGDLDELKSLHDPSGERAFNTNLWRCIFLDFIDEIESSQLWNSISLELEIR